MQYEADQNMVFNYLMVSGLAAATDMFEKNGTGMTGGEYFNGCITDIMPKIKMISLIFCLCKPFFHDIFQIKCKKWLGKK